ncbi:MAG: heme-binding protein [Betaproteobacteria bacterium]|nr:heme-binding protein [Betaproteobacteria bacterium]
MPTRTSTSSPGGPPPTRRTSASGLPSSSAGTGYPLVEESVVRHGNRPTRPAGVDWPGSPEARLSASRIAMIENLTSLMALGIALAVTAVTPASGADRPPGVLRVGMPLIAETLDPPRVDNTQATVVMAGIYDTLYGLDPLARPAALVPVAATALPEISADFRTFTMRVRPGIFFTPHPSFGGKPRELVAADFAYSIRRVLDPAIRSPMLILLGGKIEGLDALAKRAQDAGRAIDYDTPVSGLLLVDRYALRIRLNAPDPTFPFLLADPVLAGVAREVVEAEGERYGQRPVGTGGFTVAAFTPGQRITLLRNPAFRSMHWEDLLTPASRAAQSAHPMRGRKLPAVERVELSHTPEASAELLALRAGEVDLIYLNQPELATRNGRLNDELLRDGLTLVRDPAPITLMSLFSMRDPVVGGNAPEKIALRRAIHMAFDDDEWIRVLDGGFSSVRQQFVPPGIEGYIPGYRNPNRFDPAAANALLDRFGYRRGNDRMRRNPDGSTLSVGFLMDTGSQGRKRAEFIKRMLDRIGIRVAFESTGKAELLKRMLHCRFGMALMDFGFEVPDGTNLLVIFFGKSIGGMNMSCYADAEFDTAYEQALVTPAGAARTALFRTMQSRLDAYGPARPLPFGDLLFLKRPGVVGPFATSNDWLRLMTLAVEPPSAPAR